jgi:hypothetical protein
LRGGYSVWVAVRAETRSSEIVDGLHVRFGSLADMATSPHDEAALIPLVARAIFLLLLLAKQL